MEAFILILLLIRILLFMWRSWISLLLLLSCRLLLLDGRTRWFITFLFTVLRIMYLGLKFRGSSSAIPFNRIFMGQRMVIVIIVATGNCWRRHRISRVLLVMLFILVKIVLLMVLVLKWRSRCLVPIIVWLVSRLIVVNLWIFELRLTFITILIVYFIIMVLVSGTILNIGGHHT